LEILEETDLELERRLRRCVCLTVRLSFLVKSDEEGMALRLVRVSPLSIDFLGRVVEAEVEAGLEVAAEARAARARMGFRGAWRDN